MKKTPKSIDIDDKAWEADASSTIYLGSFHKMVVEMHKCNDPTHRGRVFSAQDDDYLTPQEIADAFAKDFMDHVGPHLTPRLTKALIEKLNESLK